MEVGVKVEMEKHKESCVIWLASLHPSDMLQRTISRVYIDLDIH